MSLPTSTEAGLILRLEQIFSSLLQLELEMLQLVELRIRITSGFVWVYRTPKKPTGAKTTGGGEFASVVIP